MATLRSTIIVCSLSTWINLNAASWNTDASAKQTVELGMPKDEAYNLLYLRCLHVALIKTT
ncbi:hypothetical protein N7451_009063 [Penicillium sp. IBT 35674x]|nr:hypothetical protein N7451_009063 [Penicillium sp. IBT 35674x]